MNIVYCKDCATNKVLAWGVCQLPTEHTLPDNTVHSNCGLITVEEDYEGLLVTHGSADAVKTHLETTYDAEFV